MAEVISVTLSAIGVGILLYALFQFILSLSKERMVFSGNSNQVFSEESSDKSNLSNQLKILGLSLIMLLTARMILSLSAVSDNSELFYYGLFINIVGALAIVGMVFLRFKLNVSELMSAFSIIFITLVVFILDYVFL